MVTIVENNPINQQLKGFRRHLEILRGLSSKSIAAYERNIIAFLAWLAVRTAQGAAVDDPLLISYGKADKARGRRLTAPALDRLIKKLARKAGIKRPKGAIKMHMLRAKEREGLVYQDRPVALCSQIDALHNFHPGTIEKAFHRNMERLFLGRDYRHLCHHLRP